MRSFEDFKIRMKEIDCIINLMPEKPSSENVQTINALCRASIMLLCSHLEGFLQDLMEEFIDEINQLSLGIKQLPIELYIQHNFPNGQIKSNNFNSLVKIFEEIKILFEKDFSIELEKKNFSNTESNPTPDVINKLFKIIGIDEILDLLNYEIKSLKSEENSSCFFSEAEKRDLLNQLGYPNIVNKIDKYLSEKRNGTPKKKRNVGFYNAINQLLKYRNTIAHGNRQINISIQDLISLKDEITCLVENLSLKTSYRIEVLKNFDLTAANSEAASAFTY